MRRLWRFLVAIVALVFGRRRQAERPEREERIVEPGPRDPRAELAVVALLLAAAACGAAFVVFYAIDSLARHNWLLGVSLGLCLAFIAAALVTTGKRLVANEEIEEDYPEHEHPEEQEALVETIVESGDRLTRRGLLAGAATAAAGALGLAALTPALSFGPWFRTRELDKTPWRRGRRLVDKDGRPFRAGDVEPGTFYTAFPEGEKQDKIGSPVVLVRLDPTALKLPRRRAGWAPQGIVAYSKICTHAGCAIALYRKPTFPVVEPRPALVCPCHYSTFDPADGGTVIFGPAGRALPQLPLVIDAAGELRAGGNFSGPVGPSWWGVRSGRAS